MMEVQTVDLDYDRRVLRHCSGSVILRGRCSHSVLLLGQCFHSILYMLLTKNIQGSALVRNVLVHL